MFATRLFASFRAFASVIVAAASMAAVSPAVANSSATADITAPLRASQSAKAPLSGSEDEQFRKLFNSWQKFESGDPALAASSATYVGGGIGGSVSIPSLMPVSGVRLSSNFGMRDHPVLGGRRSHKGVDLAGPIGTPVYATADGKVSRASWFSSYGLYVSIEHGNEIQTRYAHMSRLNVADGQWVKKGEVIGFIGTTGRSTGPHLHYEVRVRGEAVNPIPYMSGSQLTDASDSDEQGRGGL